MSKKTTAILTAAGLALAPAAAIADRPDEPGKQGRDKAAAKRGEAQQKQAEKRSARSERQAKKVKRVGFTLSGVGLTSLSVDQGVLTGALTLDVTAANKHARTFLGLDKSEMRGTGTSDVGTAGDAVVVRFDGLSSTDALQATDRIKVIGKVTRVRKGDETTVRSLDIRKIVVTRGEDESEDEQQPETQPTTQPAGS